MAGFRRLVGLLAMNLALSAVVAGCAGGDVEADSAVAPDSTAAAAGVDTASVVRDSAGGAVAADPGLMANPQGRIPVVEYHIIGDRESRWGRTRENLRNDMQLLYDRGYRPITIAQMLDKDFSLVPKGMSPVVFTFDDASPGQFSYIERNGNLEIDPGSAVGIWQEFARTHPDWKGKATFCLLNGAGNGHNFFGDNPKYFGQKKEWRHQKVKWLADNGFELCNHTLWHAQLSKMSDAVVQEQIARNNMGIDSAVASYQVRTMALPQGLWPKNRSLAWKGSWTDPKSGRTISYDLDAVLEVSGGPTRSPYDPAFNPHSINRIEVFGDELRKVLDQLDRSKSRFVK